MLPPPAFTLSAIVEEYLLSEISCRKRQGATSQRGLFNGFSSICWSTKLDSSERVTSLLNGCPVALLACKSQSLRYPWTAFSIGPLTRCPLRRPIWSRLRWTVNEDTLLNACWFILTVNCSTDVRLFARRHLHSRCSPMPYVTHGAPHLPISWF